MQDRVERMKLHGTEVPFTLFFRWWIAELVLALLGGYFGSDGFYPAYYPVSSGSFFNFRMVHVLHPQGFRVLLAGNQARVRVLRRCSCLHHLFRFYPYPTAVISLHWILMLFRTGLALELKNAMIEEIGRIMGNGWRTKDSANTIVAPDGVAILLWRKS